MRRFLFILGILFVYTCWQVVSLLPEHPYRAIFISIPIFLVMLVGQIIYRNRSDVFDALWFQSLNWIGLSIMGLWGTYILFSIQVEYRHRA